jgi:hypothetical protein
MKPKNEREEPMKHLPPSGLDGYRIANQENQEKENTTLKPIIITAALASVLCVGLARGLREHQVQPDGDNSLAQIALMGRERHAQTGEAAYRTVFLSVCDGLLTAKLPRPDDGKTWEPGRVGAAILALVYAHADTGDARYLDRAKAGAEAARGLFFDEGNPLPKMTSRSSHYESVTRADTLMMALLQLHPAQTKSGLSSDLRFCDR